jgi:hypothetical protein
MPETKCGFNDSSDGQIKGSDSLVFHGPSLLVNIGFDDRHAPEVTTIPKPSVTNVWALVDMALPNAASIARWPMSFNYPLLTDRKLQAPRVPTK